MSSSMSSTPHFSLLTLLCATGFIGCAKPSANDSGTATSKAAGQASVQAPKEVLGLSLCAPTAAKDSAEKSKGACSSFLLKLPAHSVSGFLASGGDANELLNKALPNVVSAKSDSSGLTLTVNLPVASTTEDIEIEMPKVENDQRDKKNYVQDAVIRAFNESASDDLYAFARKSETSTTHRRVRVTFAKITEADKKAAGADELAPYPAALNAYMGQSNVRGAAQEVEIKETRVDLSSLSSNELRDLKQNQEDRQRYPDLARRSAVTVYFQDGQLKSNANADRISDRVDTSKDYCYVIARVPTPGAGANHVNLGGIITLVTGTSSYGPVINDGSLAPEFSQTSDLGFQRSGAASYVTAGKGYNKFGNGRRDSENLFLLGCTSKKREMNVHTIITALGTDRVQVGYPRANRVEAYLDEKNGVDLNFGLIPYKQKRLDRAVGDKITLLKDIESSATSAGRAVSFQHGKLVEDKIDFKGGPHCWISNHLKAGTSFTLKKAWPNTVKLGDNPPVANGAVFSTDNPAVEQISVHIVPSWLDAPAKVTANPALLDAQAISDCFGSYISISK